MQRLYPLGHNPPPVAPSRLPSSERRPRVRRSPARPRAAGILRGGKDLSRLHRRPLVAAGLTAITLLGVPAAASAVSPRLRHPSRQAAPAKPYFDSRESARKATPRSAATLGGRTAAQRSAVRSLRSRLGTQGVVAIDPVTGTARSVQKLNGTLTGPTSGDPSAIATRWIRANATAIGLGPAAVSSLTLARTVTSHGITSLRYRQSINGIPDFDNGLRVNIDRQGRILNVTGAPLN